MRMSLECHSVATIAQHLLDPSFELSYDGTIAPAWWKKLLQLNMLASCSHSGDVVMLFDGTSCDDGRRFNQGK
jgi:hypothetical protein